MVETDTYETNCNETNTENTEVKQRKLPTTNRAKTLEVKLQANGLPASDHIPATWTWKDVTWKNIFFFGYLHIASLHALYLILTFQVQITTMFFAWLLTIFGLWGITAGAHRLWSHKAYKAKWPLRVILAFFNLISHQNGIWVWVLDHRVHHKYQDSNADPHNASRGLFFSHIGWLMVGERPEVDEKRKTIDMSDCINDPIVMFQKKYYWVLMPIVSMVMPTIVPWLLTGETMWNAYHVCVALRYTYSLHDTFLVNSFAHHTGMRPYDKTIKPSDHPLIAVLTLGEGWHNYHHVFPWDYKTAELGNYRFNATTAFIDFFAKIGWAYDLKTVSDDVIQKRAGRTGDGSNKYSNIKLDEFDSTVHQSHEDENLIWGWDDADMTDDAKKCARIIN